MGAKEPKNDRPPSEDCPPDHFSGERDAAANESSPVFPGLYAPWQEFQRSQSACLSRIADEMGVPPERIEEVVQEVWLDAWKDRQGFLGQDVDQRLATWLSKVVRSKSRNALRRMKREQAVSLDTLPAEMVDCETEEPAELMDAEERDECLNAAFEELRKGEPLNCWLVWERVVNRRSIRELSDETDLGTHAITCRIGRTLKKLGSRLSELVLASDTSGQ